jgi:hypothetical protein
VWLSRLQLGGKMAWVGRVTLMDEAAGLARSADDAESSQEARSRCPPRTSRVIRSDDGQSECGRMRCRSTAGGFGSMADCIRPAMAALEVEAAGLKAEDARAICSMLLLESVRDRMASVRVVSGERA